MDEKKPKSLAGELNSAVKYESKPIVQNNQEESAKEFDKLKSKLEDLKKKILKKYNFTKSLSILPAQALSVFAEDEGIPKDVEDSKPILMLMVIPEEEYKNLGKIRPEIVSLIKESKQNIWALIKTEVDLWNYGLDSRFEFLDAVSASFPFHDTGFLGSLRVANIHKSLVLRKFEKYVASYVIGGSLVRGVAEKESDVDTIIIIDDTDVKRMPRLELKEKLRGMIYDYIREATALAGVKNILNVQVYLLTEFWESVKDAHPVMFTFIRDGVPLYDRGTFIPWKLLLKMGKIKPSPEAIDMFMKSGDQTDSLVKRRMLDAMVDIYWGIVTPTQALMMLAGHAPPEPKILVSEVKKVLVDKEKLMSLGDLKILEKAVKLYKDYEHAKLNEISGKEIDVFKKESDDYVKKMKELRKKIEVRMQEHGADKIHEEIFSLLKQIFGSKGQGELIKDMENELVKKGKIQRRMLSIAKEMSAIKNKVKDKKFTQADMQKATSEASELIDSLIEYAQRKDLVAVEKGVLQISYKDKKAELVLADSEQFLVERGVIKKVYNGKLVESDKKELEDALAKSKGKIKFDLDSKTIDVLKKEFGEFSLGL